jgi:hypothetical protein
VSISRYNSRITARCEKKNNKDLTEQKAQQISNLCNAAVTKLQSCTHKTFEFNNIHKSFSLTQI